MRNRTNRIQVWIDDTEKSKLVADAAACGLKREAYIRSLINGHTPQARPPADYYGMMRQLYAIGNNLNQIARKAHIFNDVDRAAYQKSVTDLNAAILRIEDAVLGTGWMEESK